MLEGPECRKMAENLAKLVSNQVISSIEILSGRYFKKSPSGLKEFKLQLPLKVIGAGVHGKFIYWICAKESYIWSTLAMAGQWSDICTNHSRIKFSFASGRSVFFNDSRNFGTIKFVRGRHQMLKKLKSFGPDLLAEDISDQEFIKIVKKNSNWGITRVLMDSSLIAGIGNYIKSDSLWLSQISPHRTVSDLSDGELAVLNRSVKQVMKEAYSKSETSKKYFVYGKTIDIDGNKVVKEETDDKRSTYWAPEVQK